MLLLISIMISLLLYKHTIIKLDSPEPWGLFFQDNVTPQMEGLEELHNNIMYYLAIILFAMSWIMVSIIVNYKYGKISYKYSKHSTLLDFVWTMTPALILISIGFYSFKFLYLMDEVIDPSLVIYGEGHQWYLSYYPDLSNFSDNTAVNPNIGGEVPSSSSQVPSTGNNSGANRTIMRHDCSVKPYIGNRNLDHLEIKVGRFPWDEIFNNPVRYFEPQLNSNTDGPRNFYFRLSSCPFYLHETYFQGNVGDNANGDLMRAIEDKSQEVRNLREIYDRAVTENRLAEVRASRGSLVTSRVTAANLAWQTEDPNGYNLIKQVRILRGLESALKITEPTYISRVTPLSFEV